MAHDDSPQEEIRLRGKDRAGMIHLHLHTEYSALDGACKVSQIADHAKKLGMYAVGVSDHGTMSALPLFQDTLKSQGVKPILGAELYLTDDRHIHKKGTPTWHLGLIAETTEGYHNLARISSFASTEGFYYKPRADWELLRKYSRGLIAMTGCMASPVMSSIFMGDISGSKMYVERLIDIFGIKNVYGEIQNVGIEEVIPKASELAGKLGRDEAFIHERKDFTAELDTVNDWTLLSPEQKQALTVETRGLLSAGEVKAWALIEPILRASEKLIAELGVEARLAGMTASAKAASAVASAADFASDGDKSSEMTDDEETDGELVRDMLVGWLYRMRTQLGEAKLTQEEANEELAQICKVVGIKLVATGDVHYLSEDDAIPHDALLCIATGQKQRNFERKFSLLPRKYHFRSEPEMRKLLPHYPEAFESTIEIAERCTAEIRFGRQMLPKFPVPDEYRVELKDPEGNLLTDAAGVPQWDAYLARKLDMPASFYESLLREDKTPLTDLDGNPYEGVEQVEIEDAAKRAHFADFVQTAAEKQMLRELCEEGMVRRYGPRERQTAEQRDRLEFELQTFENFGVNSYFLLTFDWIDWCHRNDIPIGPGRGSGCGSIALYALNVTQLDPLRFNLLFERFMNPDRIGLPDVDTDVSPAGRPLVLEYLRNKWGGLAGTPTAVTQIITFGKIGAKAGIKDAARVLDHEPKVADKLTKMIPDVVPPPLQQAIDENKPLQQAYSGDSAAREILDLALKLEGYVRSEGIHAGGVVIWDQGLENALPLMQKPGKPITTAYEMYYAEKVGAVKIDVLGLRNLDIVWRSIEIVKLTKGVELHPYRIDMEDSKTYEMLSTGDSVGTFQLESGGMQDALRSIKPTDIEDLIAIVALYRPGPMANIPVYAARKHGREEVTYEDPRLEAILGTTHGVCVSGEEIVVDARTGRRLKLKDAGAEQSLLVQGIDPQTWAPRLAPVSHWIDSGTKEAVKVTLASGRTITITPDHRVLGEHGWVPIGELEVGNRIGTPRTLLIANDRPLAEGEAARARILGALIGDGGLTNAGMAFYGKDPAIRDGLKSDIDEVFGAGEHRYTERVNAGGVTRLGISKGSTTAAYHSPPPVEAWLRQLGWRWKMSDPRFVEHGKRYGVGSQEKSVPSWVFELPVEGIAEFLAAYWDCDGCVTKRNAFIKTISPTIAYDLIELLGRLGMRATISSTVTYQSKRRDETRAYHISVSRCEEFHGWIGSRMRTTKALDRFVENNGSMTKQRVLISRERVTAVIDRSGAKRTDFAMARGTAYDHISPSHYLRYPAMADSIARCIVTAGMGPEGEIERLANIGWDEIVGIEAVGPTRVYDITVPELDSFVCSNIIVHNCVYQEQLMEMSKVIGGFTPGEADGLRKAISKKQRAVMDQLKSKFVNGCAVNGLDRSVAVMLWERDFEPAADYSFNKAHAGAYGYLGYVTAYLKANHPHAYMAALLSSVMGDKDKMPLYLNEARRMGVKVLAPDVNRSFKDFAVLEAENPDPNVANSEFEVLFGLTAIKRVGDGVVDEIRAERDQGGPFRSLFEFARRMPQLNKTVLEQLVRGGAFDFTGQSRRSMHAIIEPTLAKQKKERDLRLKEQLKRLVEKCERIPEEGAAVQSDLFGGAFDFGDAGPAGAACRTLEAGDKKAIEALGKFVMTGVIETHDRVGIHQATEAAERALLGTRRTKLRAEFKKGGVVDKDEMDAKLANKIGQEEAALHEQAVKLVELALEPALAQGAADRIKATMDAAIMSAIEDPELSSEDWPTLELLNYERDALGIYASAHPLDEFRSQWSRYVTFGVGDITHEHENRDILVAGVITAQREIVTKRGSKMIFATLDDLTGSTEITFFEESLKGADHLLEVGTLISLQARVKEDSFAASKKEAAADDDADADPDDAKPMKLMAGQLRPWLPDTVDMGPLRLVIPTKIGKQDLTKAQRAEILRKVDRLIAGNSGDHPVVIVTSDGTPKPYPRSIDLGHQPVLRQLRITLGSNAAVT